MTRIADPTGPIEFTEKDISQMTEQEKFMNGVIDKFGNSTIELELKRALQDVERLRNNNLELKLKVIELIKLIRNVKETLEKTQNNINKI